MSDINTIKLNDIEYVRKDQTTPAPSGDYVIVRSRDQGVMCGYLKAIDGRQVTITQARQIWSWSTKALALPDLALHGVRGTARMSAPAPEVIFLEACGVLRCTEAAAKSLSTYEVDKVAK